MKYDGEEHAMLQAPTDGYAEEIRYFADCASRGAHADLCPPESSAQATKLALLCNEARLKNGEKIACQI